MRVIFVPVSSRPECEHALQAAFGLARRLGSDVVGCHIRPQPTEPEDWSMADLWLGQAQSWPVLNEQEQARDEAAARRLFESVAARFDFPLSDAPGTGDAPAAHWESRTGSPPALMPLIGAASDMIVVSRPAPGGGHKAWQLMMSALLESSRPVLVLPQEAVDVSARNVAVAWNSGRMETLTLHAVLPLLKAADDVVLLTVGGEARRGPSAADMVRFLGLHGVDARRRGVDAQDAGAALVSAARAEGADLLVAGAYTRGRFKEIVFGGVTEHLVTKTAFPVLMMHA